MSPPLWILQLTAKSIDKKNPASFLRDLKTVIEENPGVKVQTACSHVAHAVKASLGKYGLQGDEFRDFVLALRQAYYRDNKSTVDDQNHGNSTLTKEEEAELVGLARAVVRLGEVREDDLAEAAILELAADVFPEKSFGRKW